ncbi:hypothetical protein [Methylibium sp.]|uniref:hypothetical protein n=1 Tax=Methylibium sp. TaxID=2067992 RepID=UPI00333F08BB
MCTSRPRPPQVVERDPVREAAEAANEAQGRANAQIAARRQRMKGNSLFTNGPRGLFGGDRSAFGAFASAQPVNRNLGAGP